MNDGTEKWMTLSREELLKLLQEEACQRKAAEKALHISEERFQTVVSNTPIIIYAMDNQGTFTVSEGIGLSKIGLKPGQVVGVSANEVYKDYPDILDAVNRALLGEHVFFEHEVGETRIDNRMVPVFDGYGKVKAVIGAALDVTERKRAEEALRQERAFMDAVLDSVPGMLYLYDTQGNLIRWNKAHERMTGYTTEELGKMSLVDWYKGDIETQERILREVGNAFEQGFADAEAELQCKDGTRIPLYMTAVSVDIDGVPYITGIGIDISKRKEIEAALVEANLNLEKKVEDRTQDLTAANEELTAMNEEMLAINTELQEANEELKAMQSYLIQSEKMAALGSLVAGVAHEINTPVGVGLTAASHLHDITGQFMEACKSDALDETAMKDYLEDLQEAADILIKNLLRASKLIKSFKQVSADQSSEQKRTFNVCRYLEEILLSMTPTLRHSQLEIILECGDNVVINGYPGAFAQVITNLIMNSVAHAYGPQETGIIRIAAKVRNGEVDIHYSDDGKGIDPQTLPRIFDPFFTTRRGLGGTGLGLFVVYNIVTNQFGGTIRCESQPGEGTLFHINWHLGR